MWPNQSGSKLVLFLSLFAVTLLVPVKRLYAEGGQDSGGGGVIACVAPPNLITRTFPVDLVQYDGKSVKINGVEEQIRIVRSTDSTQEQIKRIFQLIRSLDSWKYDYQKTNPLKERLSAVLNAQPNSENNMRIIGDFSEFELPSNLCEANEVTTFANAFIFNRNKDNQVYFRRNDQLYSKLHTNTDEAALLLHEVFYSLSNQSRSDQIKELIAVLFSDLSDDKKVKFIKDQKLHFNGWYRSIDVFWLHLQLDDSKAFGKLMNSRILNGRPVLFDPNEIVDGVALLNLDRPHGSYRDRSNASLTFSLLGLAVALKSQRIVEYLIAQGASAQIPVLSHDGAKIFKLTPVRAFALENFISKVLFAFADKKPTSCNHFDQLAESQIGQKEWTYIKREKLISCRSMKEYAKNLADLSQSAEERKTREQILGILN